MQRENQTQRLTFSASMTALGVILLLLGSMLPGMRVACAAVAGVVVSLVVIRCGLLYALLSVVATAVLSFLLVPAKELALLYAVFFGPYALVKNLIERLHRLPLEWIVGGSTMNPPSALRSAPSKILTRLATFGTLVGY